MNDTSPPHFTPSHMRRPSTCIKACTDACKASEPPRAVAHHKPWQRAALSSDSPSSPAPTTSPRSSHHLAAVGRVTCSSRMSRLRQNTGLSGEGGSQTGTTACSASSPVPPFPLLPGAASTHPPSPSLPDRCPLPSAVPLVPAADGDGCMSGSAMLVLPKGGGGLLTRARKWTSCSQVGSQTGK